MKKQPPQTGSENMVDKVRERYGRIAADGGCCSSSCAGAPLPPSTMLGYDRAELDLLPGSADLGLGCGAPLAALDLTPGESVLDLGSGPGLDALLAGRRVGPGGHVIGVDMTPEMLQRARAAAEAAGAANVEFRAGRLEELPVDDASIDAVTSNCVINLVPDKAAVFREMARVLRPGGRAVISDIVLDAPLPDAVRADVLAYVGCVAGAMERGPYFDLLRTAGLTHIEVLRDVDFLGMVGEEVPEEIARLLERTGVTLDQVRGRVRAITYRARR